MSSTHLSAGAESGSLAPGYILTPQGRVFGGAALIVLAVLVAYWPAHNGGFVFDDELLIQYNPMIKAADGLYRYWFTKEALDYWPVTNTTFWLEWRLWKMDTAGYHATNIVLHIVDVLLIWVVLKKLGVPWPWLAALLFAVHPINVESVAWISQRKNVLALLFFLLSILWWLCADAARTENTVIGHGDSARKKPLEECGRHWGLWYILSVLAFVLAMLSKGSVATLPFVLLLIVWWQKGIIRWRDWLWVAPFFVVAVVLTLVDLWFQTHGGGQVIREATPIQRLLGAGAVVWFYLGKALLPVHLAFIYPQWRIDAANPLWWLPLTAASALTGFLVWQRNSVQAGWVRPVLFAWLFFCIALFPVMGFTDVGYMMHSLVSDHYEHIALIAVVALLATACRALYEKLRATSFAQLVPVGAGGVALVFLVLSWQQSGLYASALILFGDAVQKNPDSWLAQCNYGLELSRSDKAEEAIPYFQKALELNPACAAAHFDWANALVDLNRRQEALNHYRQAIKMAPEYADAHYRLGTLLESLNQPDDAEQEYRRAIEAKLDHAQAQNSLGLILASRKQFSDAATHFQQAIDGDSDFVQAYINLASAYAALGRYADAIQVDRQAWQMANAMDAQMAEGVAARLRFYQYRLSGAGEKPTAGIEAQ
jgi:protein O-mannosyl-transferase